MLPLIQSNIDNKSDIAPSATTARTIYRPNAGLMLGQRRRRWPNIKALSWHQGPTSLIEVTTKPQLFVMKCIYFRDHAHN